MSTQIEKNNTGVHLNERENKYLDEFLNSGNELARPSERIKNLRKELKKYRFPLAQNALCSLPEPVGSTKMNRHR